MTHTTTWANIMLSETSQTIKITHNYNDIKCPKQKNLLKWKADQGLEGGKNGDRILVRQSFVLRVMRVFQIRVRKGTQLCDYTKSHLSVYFNRVDFMVCSFYLNRAGFLNYFLRNSILMTCFKFYGRL